MLNGNATPVGKNCSSSVTQYSARSPTFMSIPGGLRLRRSEEVIDMVSERAVHVTGAAIEPYDVVIGEGA